jgi:serine/threonine protein kinase
MLSPGSKLGPYEILGQIGAGGMGEVYRAKDPRLGREVAIKVLPASFSADPDRLRRFEQEARAAGFATGKKVLWKEIVPADRTGLVRIENFVITPDGNHYAYSFNRVTNSDRFVATGWK